MINIEEYRKFNNELHDLEQTHQRKVDARTLPPHLQYLVTEVQKAIKDAEKYQHNTQDELYDTAAFDDQDIFDNYSWRRLERHEREKAITKLYIKNLNLVIPPKLVTFGEYESYLRDREFKEHKTVYSSMVANERPLPVTFTVLTKTYNSDHPTGEVAHLLGVGAFEEDHHRRCDIFPNAEAFGNKHTLRNPLMGFYVTHSVMDNLVSYNVGEGNIELLVAGIAQVGGVGVRVASKETMERESTLLVHTQSPSWKSIPNTPHNLHYGLYYTPVPDSKDILLNKVADVLYLGLPAFWVKKMLQKHGTMILGEATSVLSDTDGCHEMLGAMGEHYLWLNTSNLPDATIAHIYNGPALVFDNERLFTMLNPKYRKDFTPDSHVLKIIPEVRPELRFTGVFKICAIEKKD